jgi:hypothetical protein
MLAILASQSHGGNTSPCDCEARILSLWVPAVKITPHRLKYSPHHGANSIVTHRVPSPRNNTVTRANKTPPPFPRPLPTRPVPTRGWGVYHACASAHGRGCRCSSIDLQRNKSTYSLPQRTNCHSTCARPSTIRWPVSPASASLWGGVLLSNKRGYYHFYYLFYLLFFILC